MTPLTTGSARAIGEAALKSLRAIHECGISHGDISLRNLRLKLKEEADEACSKSWRACWIDYGLAGYSHPMSFSKTLQLDLCKSLFGGIVESLTDNQCPDS